MPETWKECEGQVVDGQFTLLEHLGGSDHSVVFRTQRGQDKSETAAIKFLQVDASNADAQLKRWKNAALLSHPNLIKVWESGRCQLAGMDLLYVVMELASENLAEFLPQRALSHAETRDMLEPFVDALVYLHGKGLLQGAIRPGNILAIDEQLKLSSDSIRRAGESHLGDAKTSAYDAPEVAQGASSPALDIWALGITLVEALTQRVPEPSGPQGGVEVPEAVPEPFRDIAAHALRAEPAQRWTIAEISAKLNPRAAAPTPSVATQKLPEVVKPSAPPVGAVPKDIPGDPPPPPKPAAAIDPLSIPLSKVEPLAGARRPALANQVISEPKSPARGYYILVAVILALTIGAMLAIPRFRGVRSANTESATATTSQLGPQPTAAPPPADVPKSQPQQDGKSMLPSAGQSTQASPFKAPQAKDSMQAKKENPLAEKEDLSASASPAALKSPLSPKKSVAPFVPDREASIKAGAVTPGEVLNQISPEVSEKSRSTIRGTVRTVIKVRVDTAGSVSNAEIASAGSRFFANAALDAAKQWDFAPAKVDGHAVPSEWLLHFDFTPNETKITSLPTKP